MNAIKKAIRAVRDASPVVWRKTMDRAVASANRMAAQEVAIYRELAHRRSLDAAVAQKQAESVFNSRNIYRMQTHAEQPV